MNKRPTRFNYKGGQRPEIGDLVLKRVLGDSDDTEHNIIGIVIKMQKSQSGLTEMPVVTWAPKPDRKHFLPQSMSLLARAAS